MSLDHPHPVSSKSHVGKETRQTCPHYSQKQISKTQSKKNGGCNDCGAFGTTVCSL